MTYKAKNIADYLVSKAQPDEGGELLSNMKLQKLLYYCQAFSLASSGKLLFSENIVAWQYGPVVPEVYHQFKKYGSGGIPQVNNFDSSFLDCSDKELIDEVFEVYGQYSAIRLMEMTHSEEPWIKAEINGVISVALMTEFYKPFLS